MLPLSRTSHCPVHNLHLDIANLRGDIRVISPQLAQVQKVSDLLYENQLNKEKV